MIMSSHAEVGALLVQIHQFFVSIGYVTEHEICWPPHSNDNFLEVEYRAHGIEENAIDCMRHLPWPRSFPDEGEVELFYRAHPPCYSDAMYIEGSRHPILPEFDLEEDYHGFIPGHMITLAHGKYEEGETVVLDVKDMVVREYSSDSGLYDSEPIDAVRYLQAVLKRLTALQDIPVHWQICSERCIDHEEDHYIYEKTKQALLEYGWPTALRKTDFTRDIEQLQEQWRQEFEAIIDQREKKRVAIAAVLTKMYAFFIRIGYVAESEVSWPGTCSEDRDHSKWEDAGYNIVAIEFVKSIPWVQTRSGACHELVWNSRITDWSFADDISESRHPAQVHCDDAFTEDELGYTPPHEVSLTLAQPGEFSGVALVIDANTGMIRWNHPLGCDGGEWKDSVQELESLYHKSTSFEWFPIGGKVLTHYHDPLGGILIEPKLVKAKAALLQYGWPDEFRVEDWRNDVWANLEVWEQEEREEDWKHEKAKKAQEGTRELGICASTREL